jgi:hypothetical protein
MYFSVDTFLYNTNIFTTEFHGVARIENYVSSNSV